MGESLLAQLEQCWKDLESGIGDPSDLPVPEMIDCIRDLTTRVQALEKEIFGGHA